jgi:hypothetical protein
VDFSDAEQPRTLFLTIQNSRNPEQVINFFMVGSNGHFETEGLKSLFGTKEIRVGSEDVFESPEEIAEVLTSFLETMSEAEELNLPYTFLDNFEMNGKRYTISEEDQFRVLKRGA